ncbi:MAG: sporulation initiation factor Spo0A C-terminal domain-containing protein [Lachnospiraceae bacterium]|nr:sporulation initiation factor Spo0A C-terminal domain-containing protein [Lachnospiraceae bacterium]
MKAELEKFNFSDSKEDPLGAENKKIQQVLLQIGVPTNLIGFLYLASAEEFVLNDPTELYKVTGLYADIAKKHHTSISKVERAIRHAIHTTWTRGNHIFINELFMRGNMQKAPTNSEFISRLYFYLS